MVKNLISFLEKALSSNPVNLALCCVMLSLSLAFFVVWLAWGKV
jgi:hypothetical protein